MKTLLKILPFALVLISCKIDDEAAIAKSDFSLKQDYVQLTKKLGESDTVKIWMNLSQCTYQAIEKLIITREKDSLEIESQYTEDYSIDNDFKKAEAVKVSINQTHWGFNEFLSRNNYRLNCVSSKYGRLQIEVNGEKLNFFTEGLNDTGNFLRDYSSTMKNLMPKNDYYIYDEMEIVEETK